MKDTSIEAYESIREITPTILQQVYTYIKRNKSTCYEIEKNLNLSHQTASARINDLIKLGLLKDSGIRRKTGSGRNAIVWTTKNAWE